MSVGGSRADAMGVRLHAECGELKAWWAQDAPPPPDLVAPLKPNKAEIRASPLEGSTGTSSRSADMMAAYPASTPNQRCLGNVRGIALAVNAAKRDRRRGCSHAAAVLEYSAYVGRR